MKATTVMTMMTTLPPSIAIKAFAEHCYPDTHSKYNFVNAYPQHSRSSSFVRSLLSSPHQTRVTRAY